MLQDAEKARQQNTNQPLTLQGLKQLILKLRWAGMDQEAEKLCHQLDCLAPEDCVPPEPAETD